jgi:methionine-S-sulfoxide reductase
MNKGQAIFGAGCFWGVQYYFDQVPGVLETEAGYIGGKVDNPTYELVCTHTTGHSEAVRITYDEAQLDYPTLLKHFFRLHNPTQLNRQGPDVGDSYRSAIFFMDDNQKEAARLAIEQIDKSGHLSKPVVTTIEPATTFWPAENYHQKFTERTGRGMCHVAYQPV